VQPGGRHRLRARQDASDREADRQLTGRVEIDDAYLGGEVQGGSAGRGSPDTILFVAAVQTTETGQPVLVCLVCG
jgi:hypothetical protein